MIQKKNIENTCSPDTPTTHTINTNATSSDSKGENLCSATQATAVQKSTTKPPSTNAVSTLATSPHRVDAVKKHRFERYRRAVKGTVDHLPVPQAFQSFETNYPHGIHPGLVPGIGIEEQKVTYRLDVVGLVVTGSLIVAFIAWGIISTQSLTSTADALLAWVITNLGWFFSVLAAVVLLAMLWIAVSRYGNIPLGRDDEEPEYSFGSWVAMMFAAGMGIGLLFFGAYEPMTYFLNPPPGSQVEPGTYGALNAAMAQTLLHWGLNAWAIYALVGVSVAYGAYRRGRAPLMSRIFIPLLGHKMAEGGPGRIIDMLAIATTVFGTAASLGIGAVQIVHGIEIVGGFGRLGNSVLIIIICVLTAAFIASAVSGVSRGIKYLSNINMVMAIALAIFIFFAGPTIFLLDLIPTSAMNYLYQMPNLLSRSPAWGPDTGEFVAGWTVFYWAWWVSWSPFVGMFIARISRGRTIRQFIFVVLFIPTTVCMLSFIIYGGTAMDLYLTKDIDVFTGADAEYVLFNVLNELPATAVTSTVAMICLGIFFVTSADSASVVMGSLSQQGKPTPNRLVVAFWGLCLAGIAIVGLLAGGNHALKGLQNLIIVTAVPFAIIVAFMLVALWRDLSRDPYTIRNQFARKALAKAVRGGLAQYGDDFKIVVVPTPQGEGVGADFDSTAPELTQWYQRTDEEGNPVGFDYEINRYLDEHGNPMPHTDEDGNPLEHDEVVAEYLSADCVRDAAHSVGSGGHGDRDGTVDMQASDVKTGKQSDGKQLLSNETNAEVPGRKNT
ncbi:MAG: BCCT family transporter [Actinomycetaceae bacterium]|nr:BCCT family transporter [Actinomycetaceae bacterium]